MLKLTIEDLKKILKEGGASKDFKTGRDTKKKGFIVSVKDTETQIQDINKKDINELLNEVNEALKNSVYNVESNKNNLLGFWIENNVLFIDVSKCLKVTKKDIYKVKNEAFINNQYAVYNNESNETYNLIIPIYTLYNTSDLLGIPSAESITSYSQDFYNYNEIKEALNLTSNGSLKDIIFNSIDEIPSDYNYNKVIIKDLSNYTRDVLEYDVNLSIEDASKYSRLIKEEF